MREAVDVVEGFRVVGEDLDAAWASLRADGLDRRPRRLNVIAVDDAYRRQRQGVRGSSRLALRSSILLTIGFQRDAGE